MKIQSENTNLRTRHKLTLGFTVKSSDSALIRLSTFNTIHIFMTLKYFVKNRVIFIVSLEEKKIIVLMSIRY
jgi:hypothetical protein